MNQAVRTDPGGLVCVMSDAAELYSNLWPQIYLVFSAIVYIFANQP